MFCPKCGVKNLNAGKFCRGCGANLSNVLAVVDGTFDEPQEITAPNNSAELKSTGVRNIILGFGFITIAVFLFTLPGDTIYWLFAMLPGFALFASGVSRIMTAETAKTKKVKISKTAENPKLSEANMKLLPESEDYIKPENSTYRTDDLLPQFSSVVEDTTRRLEINTKDANQE